MAWTTPRTWVTSEIVTAANMNTHVRDNFRAIGDSWTSYGSGSSWTATTSNPSLGNGTWSAAYSAAGKLINFRVNITMGSTTTYGTGTWLVDLPVTAASATGIILNAWFIDSSASSHYPGMFLGSTTTTGVLRGFPTTAGNPFSSISSTVPFTWATGDQVRIAGCYEGA